MARNYKHGQRHTRLYDIWRCMRQRCNNPNTNRYHCYGLRGIRVCDEWNKFENFYRWAIENGYDSSLTIDRNDVNGNYEPNNCRWVTNTVQQNNKRNNRYIEYKGSIHTLGEWSKITGIKIGTIWYRLKCGWSVENALTVRPVIGTNQFSVVGGTYGNTN